MCRTSWRGSDGGTRHDGPASNNNLDMFEEMDTAAKVHKLDRSDPTVMPAREVFRMATRGGAKALGSTLSWARSKSESARMSFSST